MLAAVLAWLLSVELGDPFGEAAARGRQLDAQTIEVTLTVQVPQGRSVVAHLIDPGQEQRTVAMVADDSGTFSTIFETKPSDLVVVFEVVDEQRFSQSPPVSLTQLGLDPALLGLLPEELVGTGDNEGIPDSVRRWGWLGLALGTAALSLLAFWTLGGRSRREDDVQLLEEEPPATSPDPGP